MKLGTQLTQDKQLFLQGHYKDTTNQTPDHMDKPIKGNRDLAANSERINLNLNLSIYLRRAVSVHAMKMNSKQPAVIKLG